MKSDHTEAELRTLLQSISTLDHRHLFELAALIRGVKQAVRIVVVPDEVDCLLASLARLGLHAGVAPYGLAVECTTNLNDSWTCHVPRDDPTIQWLLVYAVHDASILEKAFQFELDGSIDLGELLGYPACCVAAYEENFSAGVDWVRLLVDDWRTQHAAAGAPPSIANKLAYLFDGYSLLPDYFPCSLFCREAAALGASYRKASMECGLAEFVREASERTARPIVVWRGILVQPSHLVQQGNGLSSFSGPTAMNFEWSPTVDGWRNVLAEAYGCRVDSAGLTLLDRHGNSIEGTLDGLGAVIHFSGVA